MVPRTLIVAVLASFVAIVASGCASSPKPEIVTVSEVVEVPVVKTKSPDFPDEFTEPHNFGDVEFKQCGKNACLDPDNAIDMVEDISGAAAKLKAYRIWFKNIVDIE